MFFIYLFITRSLLAFQHVPTNYETAMKLVTNFFRIPLSYSSQIGRSKRQVILEDIVVILDRSESIEKCNYERAKQALKTVLDIASEIGYDDRYAAVTNTFTANLPFVFICPFPKGNVQGLERLLSLSPMGNQTLIPRRPYQMLNC